MTSYQKLKQKCEHLQSKNASLKIVLSSSYGVMFEKQLAIRVLRDLRIKLMDMWDEAYNNFDEANDNISMRECLAKMHAYTEAMHEVNAKLGELYGE